MTCTPSTPAPARKRRRPNHDLQQRLARCEELLQEYATAKPAATPSETTGSSPPDQLPKPLSGQLIQGSGGGVQFMDSYLWANVYDELRGMREIIDEDGKDDDSCSTPADHSTPDQNAGLLFSDGADCNTEDMHPEPAQVLGLWQIFVDRVNPITRIIHVPTLQPLMAAAATGRKSLASNKEALLFAIYTFATVALSEHECRTLLRCSRDDAFNRFSKACRITFMRIGILQRYDMVVLQALVLYQLSLSGRYDRHAAWILNGVIVRIAQKMGLHRDGQMLGLSPFETEMRRRIWWQIVLLDGIYALMSGLNQSMIPRSWDTKEPSNMNDNDMSPGMTKIEPREGPTDMVYCMLCYEVAKLLVESPGLELVILQNEVGRSESSSAADVAAARKRLDDLDARLAEILEKHCDVTMGPVHELAIETRIEMMSKMRDMICPPRDQPEWQTEIKTPQDNLFKTSVTTGEHSLRLYRHAEKRGTFLWLVMTHFPVEVYQFMVSQLATRTSGALVERAWRVLEELYQYHDELYNLSIKSSVDLAMFVVRAWRAREPALQQATGLPVEKPYFVSRVESLLGVEMGKKQGSQTTTPRAMGADLMATGGTGDMRWDQLLGYVDSSATMNWDMFGNPADMAFGGPAMGPLNMDMNGWL